MSFIADVDVRLEADAFEDLQAKLATLNAAYPVLFVRITTGDRGLVIGAAQGQQATTQINAPEQVAAASLKPAAPAPDKVEKPAKVEKVKAEKPAAEKAKTKDELFAELRAVLVPYNDRGAKEKAEVAAFVRSYAPTLPQITAEALPEALAAAKEKFK